jgi:hypothetical protein
MTNRAYAKSNGDGLLCSILCLGSLIRLRNRATRAIGAMVLRSVRDCIHNSRKNSLELIEISSINKVSLV